ncbi:hypothetical protein GDO86_013693 [Hymenochirus boettgeri]|uniref:Triacylglycerol lipase n=1 Tax=Hymenochirus boettgeri TaxID=247094 RepID=A0A8T2ISC2_9PIPI|nr:hypothetical protein GDO86_013693 [Hymenochirus boettgeri]
MAVVFTFVLLLFGCVQGGKVCYDRIGCFTDDAPWGGTLERPIAHLPMSPEDINIHLLLFTKANPLQFQELQMSDLNAVNASNFNTSKETHFIIHGFIDKGEEDWLVDMCKAMLEVEDVNCICVDWKGGSRTLYQIAANNVRVVGAEIAYFIGFLSSNLSYDPSNVHVIGHSLGAHAAGEVGKRMPGIARITGLDPAGPFFQDTPPEVRLDPSDADFVDAIHTDASGSMPFITGYGMRQMVGHMDFFPNGGERMVGCDNHLLPKLDYTEGLWDDMKDLVACNHLRSYKYYTESIYKPTGFIGFPSSSYEDFKRGVGFPCPITGCPLMGHYCSRISGNSTISQYGTNFSSQSFFLNTGEIRPFARWRYRVSILTAGSMSFMGSVSVSFNGTDGNTEKHQIASGFLHPGRNYAALMTGVESNVGSLTSVVFVWNRDLSFFHSTFGAKSVTVECSKHGEIYTFCSTEVVKKDTDQNLARC